MKILLTNVVMLNGGDAAIVVGMQKAICAAFGSDVEIMVHATRPDIVAGIYPELTVLETPGLYVDRFPRVRYIGRVVRRLRQAQLDLACELLKRRWPLPAWVIPDPSIRRALGEYATADLIVSSGGTYLRDDYGMFSNLADYRVVLALDKPLAFFTQSIGPFRNPSPTHPLREVFDKSICMLLRDGRSLEYVRKMGVHGPDTAVVPDAAFALGDERGLTAIADRPTARDSMRVAISVREWRHFETYSNKEGMRSYVGAMASLVRHLLRRGVTEIVFVSTCQGIAAYDDDSRLADEIVREAGVGQDERVSVSREFIRFDRLREVLRGFDLAVCTRLHVAILSMLEGVPVIPIAYEFKSSELFSEIGLSEYVLHIETLTSDSLISTVDRLRGNLTESVESSSRKSPVCVHARKRPDCSCGMRT